LKRRPATKGNQAAGKKRVFYEVREDDGMVERALLNGIADAETRRSSARTRRELARLTYTMAVEVA
jgi:hypothetical protein